MEDELERILAQYGILRQLYHSQSLIGEHCHRLLYSHEAILNDVAHMFKNKDIRRQDLNDDLINGEIDTYIAKMQDTMAAMDFVFSLLGMASEEATDEDVEDFKLVVRYIGTKNRW